MSRVKGPPTNNLRRFNQRLLELPRVVAIDVARRAAPAISRCAQRSFAAGRTAYDGARPLGTHGNTLSLVKRYNAARDSLLFVSDGGTKIRAVLAAPYVKFLIGKYRILPIGNAALPTRWQLTINTIVAEVLGSADLMGSGWARRAA